MRILLTNDDGIFAPGLAAIYKQLIHLGEVLVVAPADSQSGASHAVTFFEPLACAKADIGGLFSGFAVYGSPADCVKLAVIQLHKDPIDLVVAGINNGANVGINVYYSGTVAAAMEAAFLGIPSVAMSLAAEKEMDFDGAAEHCIDVLERLGPLKARDVINVNVPLLSRGDPKGIRVVAQATSGFHEYYIPQGDDEARTLFQLAGGGHRRELLPVDTTALAEGFITVTPLRPDMTDHAKIEPMKSQFSNDARHRSRGTL
ncbi:5'/3'-nucleotidase SurE [Anaerobaca lacustris]|uniref:5'/3'-nucleotidase SurE n=1 Tax=Anaerobaca lacustris TaxID=3044600 RepID=UPI003D7675AC